MGASLIEPLSLSGTGGGDMRSVELLVVGRGVRRDMDGAEPEPVEPRRGVGAVDDGRLGTCLADWNMSLEAVGSATDRTVTEPVSMELPIRLLGVGDFAFAFYMRGGTIIDHSVIEK